MKYLTARPTGINARVFVEGALRWLPREPEHSPLADTVVDDGAPGTLAPPRKRARLLLAADDAELRNRVYHLLSARWQVEAVADGQAALDAARRHKPDLVLADIIMPRLDGMALLSALRADPELSNVPVILLSARAGEEALVEGLRAGADNYLVGPFSERELIACVDGSLALAKRRAGELASMSRLNQLSARLTAASDLPSLLHEILDATMELQGADFGNIRVCDRESDTLELFAQRGFKPEFLDYFRSISADGRSSCSIALRDRRRVIIEDVLADPDFALHRDIAACGGFRAVQSTPLFERGSGALVGVLSTHFRNPHRPSERDLRLTDFYAQQAADVIAFRLAERRLRESQTRLKAAVDLLHLGSYAWDPQTNVFEWDARMKAMWGLPPEASVDYDVWRGAIHQDDVARVDAALVKLVDPRHGGFCDNEYRVIGITDGVERWIASRGTTTFENGKPVAFFGVALDVTERKQTEQANLLLIAELQHRTRNLLAVVSAISMETAAASSSLGDFSRTFGDRLSALSRVQGLLSRVDITPVTVRELVRLELQALGAEPDGRRVTVEGPEVALPNESVQILALALHELATNARKHGALATPDGRLAVTWRTTDDDAERSLAIEWREHSNLTGRGNAPSARQGFGRKLIEQALPYQLDAQTRLEFEPEGVLCSVTIRLDQRTGAGR